MSDEKPKPVDDLKQGLGLLFRAAKGAVDRLPTDKIEDAVKDGAKEVGKAFETVANELDKAFTSVTRGAGSAPPPQHDAPPPHASADGSTPSGGGTSEPKKEEQPFDDAYAPEPPKGPRVG
jgi:hypothetical protein